MIVVNLRDKKLVYRTNDKKYILLPGEGVIVEDEKTVKAMQAFYGSCIQVISENVGSEEYADAIEAVTVTVTIPEDTENKVEETTEEHDVIKDTEETEGEGIGPIPDNAPSEDKTEETTEDKTEETTEDKTEETPAEGKEAKQAKAKSSKGKNQSKKGKNNKK